MARCLPNRLRDNCGFTLIELMVVTYNTDVATLEDMEPALRDALNLAVTGTDDTFTVSVDSKAGDGGGTYSIELDSAGNVTRSCTNPGKGGCRQTLDSQGNRW